MIITIMFINSIFSCFSLDRSSSGLTMPYPKQKHCMVDQHPLDLSMANDTIFDAEDYHMFPQSENNICNNFDLHQTYNKLPECSIGNITNDLK